MRLLYSFILPSALAGIARADASHAHVEAEAEAYIIRQPRDTDTTSTAHSSSSSAPSIPSELAQAILLQRISTPDQPSVLGQLPSDDDEVDAIGYINQFGKPTSPLFAGGPNDDAKAPPKQLIIAFSGASDEDRDALRAAASGVDLAFTSPRLSALPTEERQQCIFKRAIDPNDPKCWHGLPTQVLRVDASKEANSITELKNSIATLKTRAEKGEMETVILFLAAPSANDAAADLRRRELAQEQVLSSSPVKNAAEDEDDDDDTSPAEPSNSVYPACFTSYEACMSGTSDCSGHGECAARWKDQGDAGSCFVCRCLQTTEKGADGREALYRWGGAACQKIDVSTPFWLFAGVTLALVATVTFAVGLLFGVGQEKLPGVIGAGVSRGGK